MRNLKLIIISVILSSLIILTSIPAGAVKFTSVPKHYDYQYGLDISKWNGSLNMKTLRNNEVEFAIIRVGYYKKSGGTLDYKFKENVKKCVANGIEFGVYVYSYVYKKKDCLKCAQWVHKQLKSMGNYCKDTDTIPVAYDIEDPIQTKAVDKKKISVSGLTNGVCKFSDKVKSYGYIPIVYSFQSFFSDYLNMAKFQKKGYKIWYARWPALSTIKLKDKKMMYNGTYCDIWQFSDNLYIGGKRFDTNVCYDGLYNYNKEDSKIKAKDLQKSYALGNKTSVKPSVKFYVGSKKLKSGKDYKTVFFKNNRAGTAKMKVIRYKNKKYLETKTFLFIVKPRIPQNIKTKSYAKKIDLSWTAAKGASYYEIQELDENDNTYNTIDFNKTNKYTNTFLEPAKKYYMRVRSVYEKNGKKYYSKFKNVSAYTKYSKVNITDVSSDKKGYATVEWKAKTNENCSGYEVQSSSTKNFSKSVITKSISGIDQIKTDIKLKSKKKYYFRVRSVNTIDSKTIYSTYSDVLSVKIK